MYGLCISDPDQMQAGQSDYTQRAKKNPDRLRIERGFCLTIKDPQRKEHSERIHRGHSSKESRRLEKEMSPKTDPTLLYQTFVYLSWYCPINRTNV